MALGKGGGERRLLSDISSGATCVADLDSRALALTKEASGNSRGRDLPFVLSVPVVSVCRFHVRGSRSSLCGRVKVCP